MHESQLSFVDVVCRKGVRQQLRYFKSFGPRYRAWFCLELDQRFHEDGVKSALAVTRNLGREVAA